MGVRRAVRPAGVSLPAGPAPLDELHGPSTADLTAIDAEWPLIAAELAVVDAEVAALVDGGELAAHRLADARAAARLVACAFTPAGPAVFRPRARVIRRRSA